MVNYERQIFNNLKRNWIIKNRFNKTPRNVLNIDFVSSKELIEACRTKLKEDLSYEESKITAIDK